MHARAEWQKCTCPRLRRFEGHSLTLRIAGPDGRLGQSPARSPESHGLTADLEAAAELAGTRSI